MTFQRNFFSFDGRSRLSVHPHDTGGKKNKTARRDANNHHDDNRDTPSLRSLFSSVLHQYAVSVCVDGRPTTAHCCNRLAGGWPA